MNILLTYVVSFLKGKEIEVYFQEILRNSYSTELKLLVDEWLTEPTEEGEKVFVIQK